MRKKSLDSQLNLISIMENIQSEDKNVREKAYDELLNSSFVYNCIVNYTYIHYFPYGLSQMQRICFDEDDIKQQIWLNIMEGLQKINTEQIKNTLEELSKSENGQDADYFVQKTLIKYLTPYAASVTSMVDEISRHGFTTRYYGSALNKIRKVDEEAVNNVEQIMEILHCSKKTACNIVNLYSTEFPSFEELCEKGDLENLSDNVYANNSTNERELLNEFIETLSEKEKMYLEYVFTMKNTKYSKSEINQLFAEKIKNGTFSDKIFDVTEEELKTNQTYAEWAIDNSITPERKVVDIQKTIKIKAKKFFNYKKYKNNNILEKNNFDNEQSKGVKRLRKKVSYNLSFLEEEKNLEIIDIKEYLC